MRYVKWVFLLAIVIIIILEILHNYQTLSTPLAFSLILPGNNPTLEMNFLTVAIVLFSSGFMLAVLFEIFFWFKYSKTIRQQNKIIQSLKKELETLKPPPASAALPETGEIEETRTLQAGDAD